MTQVARSTSRFGTVLCVVVVAQVVGVRPVSAQQVERGESRVVVADDGLVHLKRMKNLRQLRLQSTAVTDAGLLHLKQIKTLSDLNFKGTGITDAGVAHLKVLKHLQRLGLPQVSKGKVTRAAVASFKKARPATGDVY